MGVFYRPRGLYHQGIKYLHRASELDPFYLYSYGGLAPGHLYLGEVKKSLEYYEKILELNPEGLNCPDHFVLACVQAKELIRAEEFVVRLEQKNPDHPDFKFAKAMLLAAKGDKEGALALVKHVYTYILLDMKENAIQDMLERLKDPYSFPYLMLINMPIFDSLRHDPRFQAMVEKQKQIYDELLRKYGD